MGFIIAWIFMLSVAFLLEALIKKEKQRGDLK